MKQCTRTFLAPCNPTISLELDPIYQQHKKFLNWYKNHDFLKKVFLLFMKLFLSISIQIYILQAMPICWQTCPESLNEFMIKENKSLSLSGVGHEYYITRDFSIWKIVSNVPNKVEKRFASLSLPNV